MTPLIAARSISKEIFQGDNKVAILRQVDLTLYPGEVVAITGSSGSGKSTLLHLLGTLDMPTSGEILFFGQEISSYNLPKFRNEHIGFVFQNFYLLEDDTVVHNVLIPATIARKNISKSSRAYERAMDLIQAVGLSHRANVRCRLLSGGEKQRVAIARALMNNPSILLADEPSGNLDTKTSQTIHDLLLAQTSSTRGVLIVTHNKELAKQCHREGILRNGFLSF